MNLRNIAEVAAMVAWFGVDRIEDFSDRQPISLTEYWKTTRFLCRRWMRQLRTGVSTPNRDLSLNDLAEEIIVSELLTRCLGASLFELGELTSQPEFTHIARRTLAEHSAIREKAISKLEQATNSASDILRIERLARKTERWADLLISRYSASDAALEAAFDCERCLDFADDWQLQQTAVPSSVSLQLQITALALAIPNQEIIGAVNSQAHEDRARVALSFLNATCSEKRDLSIAQVQRMILACDHADSQAFYDL